MKWLVYYIVKNLVAVAVYFTYHTTVYLQPFLNINCDVSARVKFATRSGIVSYVGKVVSPGDWDNIIRNVIFRGREGKSFYDIHKSCHFGCP